MKQNFKIFWCYSKAYFALGNYQGLWDSLCDTQWSHIETSILAKHSLFVWSCNDRKNLDWDVRNGTRFQLPFVNSERKGKQNKVLILLQFTSCNVTNFANLNYQGTQFCRTINTKWLLGFKVIPMSFLKIDAVSEGICCTLPTIFCQWGKAILPTMIMNSKNNHYVPKI